MKLLDEQLVTYRQISMTYTEPLSIDAIVEKTLKLCGDLPQNREYTSIIRTIRDLNERLAGGKLRIAVLGQFNRGKSSFINKLLSREILPTSVLPITTVPTVITYGETNECVISFSDQKEEVKVRGEESVIYSQLLKYVTEKNNPKNGYHVDEAVVRCNSPFLLHGTAIIDTPGFGSTHTHNTQTTLDLLSSCDAALFLLSADLPITQGEVDFLKLVIPAVPRIFFIYNKIDLLSGDELRQTQQFIRDVLIKRLGFPDDVGLFPVSTKMLGRSFDREKSWEESGFASVKTHIIDFLHHEKYFTLSEALTGKLRDSLGSIRNTLQTQSTAITKSISTIKELNQKLRNLTETVRRELQKTRNFAEAEEKALIDHCMALIEKRKGPLLTSLKRQMEKLCFSISGNNPESVISAALGQLFEEHFKNLSLYLISELNKPMRKATNAHLRDFHKLCDMVNKEIGIAGVDPESRIDERMELSIDQHWKVQAFFTFKIEKGSFLNRFSTLDKRSKQLLEQYGVQIQTNIEQGTEGVVRHTKELVSKQIDSFMREIAAQYELLLSAIAEKERETIRTYEEEQEKVKPELCKNQKLIEGFSDVLAVMAR